MSLVCLRVGGIVRVGLPSRMYRLIDDFLGREVDMMALGKIPECVDREDDVALWLFLQIESINAGGNSCSAWRL